MDIICFLSEIVKIGMCRWKYCFNEEILHMFAKQQIGFWWRKRSISSVTFIFLSRFTDQSKDSKDCNRIESTKNKDKRRKKQPFEADRGTILSFYKIVKWKDVKKNIMHPHELEQTGRLIFYYFHYWWKDVPGRNRCFPKVKDLNEVFRKLNKK